VLANLFLHYAFDAWMAREFPTIAFERYVDDVVVHCVSEKQALLLRDKIGRRLAGVGLTLHPEKTKIVYCRDGRRAGSHEHTSFTFLGYTFRARAARDKHGEMFTSFLPAISKDATKAINREVRSWRLHLHNTWTLGQLAGRNARDRAQGTPAPRSAAAPDRRRRPAPNRVRHQHPPGRARPPTC
jgi:hypothetical protein